MLEIAGWLGAFCIVIAFALSIRSGQTFFSISLNLLGSAALVVEAYTKRDFQVVALNAVWLVVAGYGLVSLLG